MDVTLAADALASSIRRAGQVEDLDRGPLVQLSTVGPDRVEVAGTSREADLRLTVPATVNAQGRIVLPWRPVAGFLGHETGDCSLRVDGRDAKIAFGQDRLALYGADVEWRELVEPIGTTAVIADRDIALIAAVSSAAARDMAKPARHAVLLRGGYATATDSFRIARARIGVGDLAALVPLPAVATMQTAAAEATANGDPLTLFADQGRLWLVAPTVHLRLQLVEYEFPNLDDYFPPTAEEGAMVRTSRLKNAIDRIAALGETSVALSWDQQDALTVSAVSPSAGSSAVQIPYTGIAPANCLLTLSYVREMLAIMKAEAVAIRSLSTAPLVMFEDRVAIQVLIAARDTR